MQGWLGMSLRLEEALRLRVDAFKQQSTVFYGMVTRPSLGCRGGGRERSLGQGRPNPPLMRPGRSCFCSIALPNVLGQHHVHRTPFPGSPQSGAGAAPLL